MTYKELRLQKLMRTPAVQALLAERDAEIKTLKDELNKAKTQVLTMQQRIAFLEGNATKPATLKKAKK